MPRRNKTTISIPKPLPERSIETGYEAFQQLQQAKANSWQLRLKAEALHEASRERWIPASEGLPPTGVKVYVVVRGWQTTQEVSWTWGSDTNPQWYREDGNVTHWRAIHEYPKD